MIEGPPPRYYHVLAKSGDMIIMFSGMNTHNFIFNDTYFYALGNIFFSEFSENFR
jgi:hypothetical protein